jgi:hypothetical protein
MCLQRCYVFQSRPLLTTVTQHTPLCTRCCAAGLNFLSVYAALSLNYHTRSHPTAVGLAVCSVALGAFLVSDASCCGPCLCVVIVQRTGVQPLTCIILCDTSPSMCALRSSC